MAKQNNTSTAHELIKLCNAVTEMRRLQHRQKTERSANLVHAVMMAERNVDTIVAQLNMVIVKPKKQKTVQSAFRWLAQ